MKTVQAAGALNMISIMYTVIPLVFYVLIFILTLFLNVEEANRRIEQKMN